MQDLKQIANLFDIEGDVVSVERYGEGHINVTYLLVTTKKRYILQKINNKIFPDTDALMSNIRFVTEYLRANGVETLCVVPLKNGEYYLKGEDNYRLYDFIENTVSYQTITDKEVFKNSGRAFGEFQNQLASFDASKLYEVIPNFHNTVKRFNDFKTALESNLSGRKGTCEDEINFVLKRENTYSMITERLADGRLPLRVTHNDTKLNNILMDAKSGNARAVIDLDTIMPGSMLYDFGDSIRFGASTAAEDEKDLDKVHFSLELFKAYAEGYVSAVKDSITTEEAHMLPIGAYMMTIECGMRFLTDYVNGDTYFATKYPEHNLVRCRTQFRLAEEMENSFSKMNDIIAEIIDHA